MTPEQRKKYQKVYEWLGIKCCSRFRGDKDSTSIRCANCGKLPSQHLDLLSGDGFMAMVGKLKKAYEPSLVIVFYYPEKYVVSCGVTYSSHKRGKKINVNFKGCGITEPEALANAILQYLETQPEPEKEEK